jgi:ribosome-binding protein aMBF1 (putative translation factor)
MTKAIRQSKASPIGIAEDLHKYHSTAEAVFRRNPQETVYTEESVIKILTKNGLPEPDFASYANIAEDSPKGYINKKKELLRLVAIIKQGMEDKGFNNKQLAKLLNIGESQITKILSGANMTAVTMFRLERVLDIKLLNH